MGSCIIFNFFTGIQSVDKGVTFELWLRIYSPKLRVVRVAKGSLPWELLEHHLIPPSPSSHDIKKLDELFSDWHRDLSRYGLSLYDAATNQPSARLYIDISYR